VIFSSTELFLVSLIFMWAGFVRTGLGFGGAALGLPLMLLVGASPVYWLPVIGLHLLFFSSLSLLKSIREVDWAYLKSDKHSHYEWCTCQRGACYIATKNQ
jgi:uncharacterized membrane protein YfcA